MDKTLQGRVAIITGAAGDIGMAMAQRFGAAGARVALIDRTISTLKDLFAVECDVSSEEQVRAAVAQIARQLGAIHILVNNAAADTPKNRVADLALEDWQKHFAVNVTGAFLMAKHAIPHMRAAGGGVVLNIASQLGRVTLIGSAAYSASKAALISLTRSIALDHAADGIRAVSLSPGAIMTSRLTRRYGSEEAVNRDLAGRHPIGRLGTPQEVANAALFLAGGDASFFTGADVLMDGGYTAV